MGKNPETEKWKRMMRVHVFIFHILLSIKGGGVLSKIYTTVLIPINYYIYNISPKRLSYGLLVKLFSEQMVFLLTAYRNSVKRGCVKNICPGIKSLHMP